MKEIILIIFFQTVVVLRGEEILHDFLFNAERDISEAIEKVEEATPLASLFNIFGNRREEELGTTPRIREGGLFRRPKVTTPSPALPKEGIPTPAVRFGGLLPRRSKVTTPAVITTKNEISKLGMDGLEDKLKTLSTLTTPVDTTEAYKKETSQAPIRGGGLIRRTKTTTTATTITSTESFTESDKRTTTRLQGGGLIRRTKAPTTTTLAPTSQYTKGSMVTIPAVITAKNEISKLRMDGLEDKLKTLSTLTTPVHTTEAYKKETAQAPIRGGGLIRRTKTTTTATTITSTESFTESDKRTTTRFQGGGLIRRTKATTTTTLAPTSQYTKDVPVIPTSSIALTFGNEIINKNGVIFKRINVNEKIETIISIPNFLLADNAQIVLLMEEVDIKSNKESIVYDVVGSTDGKITVKFVIPKGMFPNTMKIQSDQAGMNIVCTSDINILEQQETSDLKFEKIVDTGTAVLKITVPNLVQGDSRGIVLMLEGINNVNSIPLDTTIVLDNVSPSEGVTMSGINYEVISDANKKKLVKIKMPEIKDDTTVYSTQIEIGVSPSTQMAIRGFKNDSYSKNGVQFDRVKFDDFITTTVTVPNSFFKENLSTILRIEEIVADQGIETTQYDVFSTRDKQIIQFTVPVQQDKFTSSVTITSEQDKMIIISKSNPITSIPEIGIGAEKNVIRFETINENGKYISKVVLPISENNVRGNVFLFDGIKNIGSIPSDTIVKLKDLSPLKGVTDTNVNYEISIDDVNRPTITIYIPSSSVTTTSGMLPTLPPPSVFGNDTFTKNGIMFKRLDLGQELITNITIPQTIVAMYSPIMLIMKEFNDTQTGDAINYNIFNNTDGIATVEFSTPIGKTATILTIEKNNWEIVATSTTVLVSRLGVKKSSTGKLETIKTDNKYIMKIVLPFLQSTSESVLVLKGINEIDNIAPNTIIMIDESTSLKGEQSGVSYEFSSGNSNQKIIKINFPIKGNISTSTMPIYSDGFTNGTHYKDGITFNRISFNGKVTTNVTISDFVTNKYNETMLIIEEKEKNYFAGDSQYDVFVDKGGKLGIKFSIPKSTLPTRVTIDKNNDNFVVSSTTIGLQFDTDSLEAIQMEIKTTTVDGIRTANLTLPDVNKGAKERLFKFENIEAMNNLPIHAAEFVDLSSKIGRTKLGIAYEFLCNDTEKMEIKFVLPPNNSSIEIKSIKELAKLKTFDLGDEIINNLTVRYLTKELPHTTLIIEEDNIYFSGNVSKSAKYDVLVTEDNKNIILKLGVPKGRSATILTIETDNDQITVRSSTNLTGKTNLEDTAVAQLNTTKVDGHPVSKITLPYTNSGNNVHIFEDVEGIDNVSLTNVSHYLTPLLSGTILKKYESLLNISDKKVTVFKIPYRKNRSSDIFTVTEDALPMPTTFGEFVEGFVDAVGLTGTVVMVISGAAHTAFLVTTILLLLHRYTDLKFLQSPGLSRACQLSTNK